MPFTLVHQGIGDHLIQKCAVVADDEHGAIVVLQQLLQQLQGVNVQIVGRFIQHQYVGGSGEQTRQQQAIAFAARQ